MRAEPRSRRASRLCVKNIPKHLNEKRLKEHFETKGEVTDVKIIRTKDGRSRQIGFVGYRSEKEAKAARHYFNGTYVDTSKISVEFAKAVGDPSLSRPWSKYSQGSSAYEKRHPSADGGAGKKDGQQGEKGKKAPRGEDAVMQLAREDPRFKEFLEVMAPRTKGKVWGNDEAAPVAPEAAPEAAPLEVAEVRVQRVASRKAGGDGVFYERKHFKFEDEGSEGGGASDDEYEALPDAAPPAPPAATRPRRRRRPRRGRVGGGGGGEDHMAYLKRKVVPRFDEDDAAAASGPESAPAASTDGEASGSAAAGAGSGAEGAGSGAEPEKKKKKSRAQRRREAAERRAAAAAAAAEAGGAGPGEGAEPADAGETGRLFVRNLHYGVTEEDLQKAFSKFGPLSEVHVVTDAEAKRGKGLAHVQFMFPEHAVAALQKMDGVIFQGRLMHVLPGRPQPAPKEQPPGRGLGGTSAFKQERAAKQASLRDSEHNWAAMYMRGDAAVGAMAGEMGVDKAAILDPTADASMAVRVALAETHVIAATRDALAREGINVEALSATGTGVRKERSRTAMVAKNLPAGTTEADIRALFGKFGALARVAVPPAGALAVVEFVERGEAKRAFRALAYKQFKQAPLYLEWAPAALEAGAEGEGEGDGAGAGPGGALFVKNLNFETTEETLRRVFERAGPLRSCTIARKRDPRKGAAAGATLSQGYGFVEFARAGDAARALKELQGVRVDDHALVLKISHRKKEGAGAEAGPSSRGAAAAGPGAQKAPSTKVLLRNLAFEATKKEVRELFRPFGEVRSVRLPKKFDGTHRGFAFVEFVSRTEAAKAVEALKNSHLYGRHLVLEFAKEDDSVEALRAATAKHFAGASAGRAAKRRKIDEEAGSGEDEEMEDTILAA
eukprot:tig00000893_g5348.t1